MEQKAKYKPPQRRLAEYYDELFLHYFPPPLCSFRLEKKKPANFDHHADVANILQLGVKTNPETLVNIINSSMDVIRDKYLERISDLWQAPFDQSIIDNFKYDELTWLLTLKKTGGAYSSITYLTLTLPNDGFLYLSEPLLNGNGVVLKDEEVEKFKTVLLRMTNTFLPNLNEEQLHDCITHRFDAELEQFECTISDLESKRVFRLIMHNEYPTEYSGPALRRAEEPAPKFPGQF